jgi:hypothetical protein
MRGRPSPEPLVEARRLLTAGEIRSLVVLLTDLRCVENLAGLAASVGWSSRAERATDGSVRVAMRARRTATGSFLSQPVRGAEAEPAVKTPLHFAPYAGHGPRTVVVVASKRIGEGEMGEQILGNFLQALPHAALAPDALVLLNEGARLIEESSGVSAALEAISRRGTSILVGASCVERFGLTHQLRFAKAIAVSELTNLLLSAERVVRL